MRRGQRPRSARGVAKKPRVYLDECVGPAGVQVFVEARVHLQTAQQAGLLGRSDEDHFNHCWNSGQILVTHDWDFWNAKKLPDYRNPGIAILDCDERDTEDVQQAARHFLRFCSLARHDWRRTRVAFAPNGIVTVMRQDPSGAIRTRRFVVTEDEVKPFVLPRRKR